ncbi:restriction endonuclease subunit S [Pseudomonas carnis]|uniref:Type I restriction modification DNA specificity domain-containing protein n=1 Tax=Pseudomonas cremoris TaxID=2724178 RepID=A0ABR6TA24_9PSED|nr:MULTISPECIES: restriction endonuclease subunit S [Pseudomonas]MBC2382803.1 hypothetical protein [Pseudomonas cremoris]MBW9238054.1 restriction endonuclease subunit S [Pseudomonas carnis]
MSAEIKPGYKLTELGVIPEEWNYYSVEQLISEGVLEKPMDGNHGNIHPKSSDFVSDGIPFVMANNIKDGNIDLRNCSFIRKSQADSLQKGFSKPGDVLLTHKATIGQVAIVGCIKTEYIMLTPQVTYYRVANTSRLNNVYLRHFFGSDVFQRVLQSMSGGGTRSYIGITAQRLLPVLLPPLVEQLTIAEYLSDMDALISGLDQLIAKKRDIKQAAMQQLLTGQQRLPGFSGEWEMKRLGDVLSRVANGALYISDEKFGVPVTRIETIATGTIDLERVGLAAYTPELDKYRVEIGDILFSHINSIDHIGKVAYYGGGEALYHGMNLLLLRPGALINNNFLFLLLSSEFMRRKARLLAKQAVSQASINTTELKGVELLVPPLPEQAAIATILSDMDSELATLKTRVDKARHLKQAAMQVLLTGRIRT